MQPIMAVWAGYSLNQVSVPEADLAPFIQAAKDQVSTWSLWFSLSLIHTSMEIDFVIADSTINAMGEYLPVLLIV